MGLFCFKGGQNKDKINITDYLNMNSNLCPKCQGKFPSLVEIHSDNENIVLKCTCQKDSYDDKIENYYEEIKSKNKKVEKVNTNQEIFYCKKCKKYFLGGDKDHEVHPNEKKEEDFLNEDIITKKNESLCKMIRVNQVIVNTFEKNPNNYFHAKSVINLAESILNEKDRSTTYINRAMKKLRIRRKKHKKCLKKFNTRFGQDINGNEERICLFPVNENGIRIGDEGFKFFTRILFIQLKEMDLADNNISDIKDISYMILPHLEYLDLSYNKIKDINPIAKLKCEKLKEICLQKNEIEDISPFKDSYFPELELLRVEDNKKIDKSTIKEVINNLNNSRKKQEKQEKQEIKEILIYEVKTPKEFDKKYETAICSDEKDRSKIKEYKEKLKKQEKNKKKTKSGNQEGNLEISANQNENVQRDENGEQDENEEQKGNENQEENGNQNQNGNQDGNGNQKNEVKEKKIEEVKNIALYEQKYGILQDPNKMLRDFYLTIPKRNKIKYLILFNCQIKDPSILARFPFYNLKALDLSLNKITNINFLCKMRTQKIQSLYLNHNKINDIKALLKIMKDTNSTCSLNILSLNKNSLDFKQKKNDIKMLIDIVKAKKKNKVFEIDIYPGGHFDDEDINRDGHYEDNEIDNNETDEAK
jgi:Leucine-rich repeat (LRR) protein